MRRARRLSPLAVLAVAAAMLLAACSRRDGEQAPGPSAASGSPIFPGLITGPSASPAASGDAPAVGSAEAACGGDACGADACSGDACGSDLADQPAQAAALRRVASDQVCMRTNRFLARPQRSIEVEGRAYYGCCAGCTKQLTEKAAVRTAKDPVTGQDVDKASAVIAARPDGTVVYFASEETFRRAGGA